MLDVIIIGGGVIGTLIAKDLSKYKMKIALLEKENDVANGTTKANSAIVHVPYNPKKGSLKYKFNNLGYQMFEDVTKELQVSYKKCGAFLVATNIEEEGKLIQIYYQGLLNKLNVELLSGEQARKLEPALSKNIHMAMTLDDTAIVNPWELTINAMENAMMNGAELHLNQDVVSIEKRDNHFVVTTKTDQFLSKLVINASGVAASRIYKMVNPDSHFEIIPTKGEYFLLDKQDKPIVSRVIYPTPTEKGKGVLVVPTVDNNILLGPNAEATIEDDLSTTKEGLDFTRKNIHKIIENFPSKEIIRAFGGLRARTNIHDFIIEESSVVPGFINVAGMESPGLASSPAISEYVSKELVSEKYEYKLKEDYIKGISKLSHFFYLSKEEKNEMIKENPDYGEMVCRCELITKGEIVEAINRPCGGNNVQAIKRRTRAGMGKCQGGFCEPQVLKILSEQLNIKKHEVNYDGLGSEILLEKTKGETL